MKHFLFLFCMTMVLSMGYANNGHDGTMTIDTKNSTVTWVGKKVTGEHTGTLGITSGTIKMKDGTLKSASITLDMTAIACTDLEDEKYNQKLIGHLSSDDFFSVEKFPEATFESTSIAMAEDGSGYEATGNLKIKGITHEISFPVTVSDTADGNTSISGKATFDRTKWNIQYGSGKFFESLGDKMIYDDVELSFSLVVK